jgi:hypothetical protein
LDHASLPIIKPHCETPKRGLHGTDEDEKNYSNRAPFDGTIDKVERTLERSNFPSPRTTVSAGNIKE